MAVREAGGRSGAFSSAGDGGVAGPGAALGASSGGRAGPASAQGPFLSLRSPRRAGFNPQRHEPLLLLLAAWPRPAPAPLCFALLY